MSNLMHAINRQDLEDVIKKSRQEKVFSYNLDIKLIPSKNKNGNVTICCHGYGGDNRIVDAINYYKVIDGHLIGFNFPDYNLRNYNAAKSSFGTIQEILPLLYVLKLCVIDAHLTSINLYGFSAGGGAIVNMLSILNNSTHDQELTTIGITQENKKKLIAALEAGNIILDCPLKSWEEVMALRGRSKEFEILEARYVKNNMRPIDAVSRLHNAKLTIFLHFQNPDEIINNRDDKLFIDRLCAAHNGATHVTSGNDGGHVSFHKNLWKKYKENNN